MHELTSVNYSFSLQESRMLYVACDRHVTVPSDVHVLSFSHISIIYNILPLFEGNLHFNSSPQWALIMPAMEDTCLRTILWSYVIVLTANWALNG